jgi:hypothetical protein
MSSYIRKTRSLEAIKSIVVKALISNGFSETVRLEDRKYQLTVFENRYAKLWLVLSYVLVGSIKNAGIWTLTILLALLAEQIIDIIIYRFRFRSQSGSQWFYERLFSRSLYKRMNIWLAVFLIAIFLRLVILFSFDIVNRSSVWFIGISTVFVQIAVMDNSFRMSIKDKLLSLGLWLIRGMSSILKTRFSMVAPGVILAFILASISNELWQFIDTLSWTKLLIIILGLVVLVIIPSISSVGKSLRIYFDTYKFTNVPFLPESLYKAVIQCTSREYAKRISIKKFDLYPEGNQWKWQKKIVEISVNKLFDELRERVHWHLWLGVFFLLPLLFIFMSLCTSFLFPELLTSFGPSVKTFEPSLRFLFRLFLLGHPLDLDGFWNLFLNDPLIKYSALSSVILITNFVLNYVQNGKTIISNIQGDEKKLNAWFTLLCAYNSLKECEYQEIDAFHEGYKGLARLPVVLVPSDTDNALMERVANRLQVVGWYRSPCVFMMRANHFLDSAVDVSHFGGDITEIPASVIREEKGLAKCCVWLERKNGNTELREFTDLYTAYRWALRQEDATELRNSERHRLLFYT